MGYVIILWGLTCLLSKAQLWTGTLKSKPLLLRLYQISKNAITRRRLSREVSWVLRNLSYVNELDMSKARAWTAKRVEQENLKATEYTLDCYICADNLQRSPRFEYISDDTEDLEFLCSEQTIYDLFGRSLKDALVDTALRSKHVTERKKLAALETLAHLSYMQLLALKPEERLRLAREFVKLCKSLRDREVDGEVVGELYTSLTGLANLAKSDPGVGSFLKGERLFSKIVAGLLNPSTPFACGCFDAGQKQATDMQPLLDVGYNRSELSTARKQLRASKADPSTTDCGPPAPRATLPPAMEEDLANSIPLTFTNRMFYPLVRFWYNIPWKHTVADVTRQCCAGFWYRVLAAGVRLISNLSAEKSNHAWLLEQGALQAVAKILQHLPADRMRSGQQEAALFVYRLFENHRIRTTIGRSPILKAAVSRIVLELRAIDSDLFGVGWGRRIGSQPKGFSWRPDDQSESVEVNGQGSEVEIRPTTSGQKEQSVPEEAEGAGNGNNDERRQDVHGDSAQDGRAKLSPPSPSSQEETKARRPETKKRRECAREGCNVENQASARLKVCARCRKARYCSKECQKADFSFHKTVCKS